MEKIYTYKNCSTCKKALNFLKDKNLVLKEIPIRENPPKLSELKKMLAYKKGQIKKILNTSSKDYRENNFKEKVKKLSPEKILKILSENGNLIKRPFYLGEEKGLVGFKIEEWEEKFKKNE